MVIAVYTVSTKQLESPVFELRISSLLITYLVQTRPLDWLGVIPVFRSSCLLTDSYSGSLYVRYEHALSDAVQGCEVFCTIGLSYEI
ncbi:hypothetical protein VPHD292_0048 [Vibrio phage D292]